MTLRIGWLSPLSPMSGVGTFSNAVAKRFPASWRGEDVDLTLLYPDHAALHSPPCRSVRIENTDNFRKMLELFDLLVYNIGNNAEHHDVIFSLLRSNPGVVICHDYVYQHYLAGRSMETGRSFASYAALLIKYGAPGAASYIARSRITSRIGQIRYAPWDSEASTTQPMSESILDLGSALVVHSAYAEAYASRRFSGPILKLGMPCDQKPEGARDTSEEWARLVVQKSSFALVSFGHVQPTKCIHLVLEAIASSSLLRRKLRYTIAGYVGDGDYFEALKDFVAAEGLQQAVRFETDVSDDQLVEIMADADIFINLRNPNTEGSSASLTEQLDSGRPVVVFDSGCYGEIPREAAIKLPAEAGCREIRLALEQLVLEPRRLSGVGRAGRAYARGWTCASYGEHLMTFLAGHLDLLRRRGGFTSLKDRIRDRSDQQDDAWVVGLAQARSSLRYLDCNVLMVDPELVLRLTTVELCSYVEQVIFGIFDDARLQRALISFFASREGADVYWACVRFALVVEAVMAGNADAQERLAGAGACFEIDFWEVIEALTFDRYVMTASLIFLGRGPQAGDVPIADATSSCEPPTKRHALRHIVEAQPDGAPATPPRFMQWLEQPCELQQDVELPCIERELHCAVGGADFREHADLSGFYPQEPGHAWTRGERGFIGLRLGPAVRKVEVAVRAVNAKAEQPATLKLSSGTAATETTTSSGAPLLLTLDIPPHLTRSNATIWLQLSTSHIGSPEDHPDDERVLGICLMALTVSVGADGDRRSPKAASPSDPVDATLDASVA